MSALMVAIAAEGPDAEIYRSLMESIIGRPIRSWTGPFAFYGCKAVAKAAPVFLGAAARAGVAHAMLAIDNDGGSKRRPEHTPFDVAPPFTIDDDDTCRECWLTQAIPSSWKATTRRHCVAVPVQTVETWLLAIRGIPPFNTRTPEQQYARNVLKRMFYGSPLPSESRRVSIASEELTKPGALSTLGARPSFQRFASQLAGW